MLIWPVAVQGAACAPEVAAAIRGFNAIAPGGPVPRPDVIIVARGGGSLEDLWGFNEEIVVRAAADSAIPLISAVGHETDTTLLDHAADLRAPTPTAAAELAVPVRIELIAALEGMSARGTRALVQAMSQRGLSLRDLARALPRAEALVAAPVQRLDLWSGRLHGALGLSVAARRGRFERLAGRVHPAALLALIRARAERLIDRGAAMGFALQRRIDKRSDGIASLGARLDAAHQRGMALSLRHGVDGQARLEVLGARLHAAPAQRLAVLAERLDRLDRLRQTLGHGETLKRGFAIVRGDGAVVTTRARAEAAKLIEIEFQDGRLVVQGTRNLARRSKSGEEPGQGSLF